MSNIRVGITGVVNEIEWTAEATKKMQGRRDALGVRNEAYEAIDTGHETLDKLLNGLAGNFANFDNPEEAKKMQTLNKFIGAQFDKITDVMTKGVNMAFGVVEDIYKEMKKASPLLQTLESLFNLAMQLFFMPLGNKLAEVLLPAVINLVETAAKMWDELGEGNLSTIFSKAFEHGIKALTAFFSDIGNKLRDQGGILGSIGSLLTTISNFIKNHGESLIKTILDLTNFVVSNLKAIIAAIIAFKVASLTMTMVATAAQIAGKTEVLGTTIGAGIGMGILAGGAALIAGSAMGYADGGIVPHTPGGRLITVAENEDEIIMPRSKAGMGGNVINNFYGYTSDDIKEMIDRSVSEKISISRLKGGF